MPASRDDAAALLLDVLAAACRGGGEVRLIGSWARPGEADAVSDVDLRWTVPESEAPRLLRSLRSTLQGVGTVESLRVDPEARTDEVLVFVRFEEWPLWWRVDLEVHAPGAHAVGVADADPWSPEESACIGVVVTVKALARYRLRCHYAPQVGAFEAPRSGGLPMPAWVYVFGVIVLLVVAVLAVDWFTAGRGKRRGVRAKDQYASDAGVGYTVIERQQQSTRDQMPPI